jgi:hypothetical protein
MSLVELDFKNNNDDGQLEKEFMELVRITNKKINNNIYLEGTLEKLDNIRKILLLKLKNNQSQLEIIINYLKLLSKTFSENVENDDLAQVKLHRNNMELVNLEQMRKTILSRINYLLI